MDSATKFFWTMIGPWQDFGRNLTAKFLIMGSLMYLVGCFQGSLEALRSLQEPTHFTDFVISHSHLTVFGTFVVWAIAGTIYVWPKIHDQELWSFKMGNWSFWLITSGITLMGLVLTMGGLMQGTMWMKGTEWLDTVVAMRPYWLVRTFAGISMDIGISLLVINLMKTALPVHKIGNQLLSLQAYRRQHEFEKRCFVCGIFLCHSRHLCTGYFAYAGTPVTAVKNHQGC
ncbi:MAG: hypothetical protein Ct9H300mP28_18550 [Pseudomonadota bacterium]|nr:MAG: hypothetical protein Ct9H300mP28_18550 [Pseudomonadota bacterium]